MERTKGDKRRYIRGVLGGRLAVGLFALALLGVGCSTEAFTSSKRMAPTGIAPHQAVTVVLDYFCGEYSHGKEGTFVECVSQAVHKAHPTVRIVSPDEFRRTAFPGLAPEEVPPRPWEELANETEFRKRIAPLNLRYLISVSGRTEQEWVVVEPVAVEGRMYSTLEATIIDLSHGRQAGVVDASVHGTSVWPVVPPTETEACEEIGEGVERFLAGE